MDTKSKLDQKRVDTKEFKIPETLFIRDIENKVFQSIVLQCLAQIDGINLVEGNFIDHLLGRSAEGVKGIHAQQDDKSQAVEIKVEVNILYGISIPEIAEKIQTEITDAITKLTGLHVAAVHVVFKNVITAEQATKLGQSSVTTAKLIDAPFAEEYSDDF